MCKTNETQLEKCVKTTLTTTQVDGIRKYVFLSILLRASDCPAKRAAVHDTRRNLKTVRFLSQTRLCDEFDGRQLRDAWQNSLTMMVEKYTEHNTVAASDGQATCRICMENVPDFLHHGVSSAHGGVCGSCALRIAMERNPRCSLCNQLVRMVCVRSSSCASDLVVYDP